mgnify:CR=1 FL=1
MLDLDGANVFVSGFERPNLFLEVYKARGKRDKLSRASALVAGAESAFLIAESSLKRAASKGIIPSARASRTPAGCADEKYNRSRQRV